MFGRKGQSGIEYLTTYGWMVVAVSLVGGTMYTQVDTSCQLTTQGFSSPFPVVDEVAQYSNETLVLEVRNPSEEDIRVKDIMVQNNESTKGSFEVDKNLRGESSNVVSTNRFSDTENCNTHEVEIKYERGSLDNLSSEGSIKGPLRLISLVAGFTVTPGIANTTDEIQFNASETESENDIESYKWDFGDGTTEDEKSPTHNYSSNGVYNVELTVETEQGVKDSKTKQIYIGDILAGTRNFTRIGFKAPQSENTNSLSTNCMGGGCENKTEEEVTIQRNGSSSDSTIFSKKLIKQSSKLCITSRLSLETDEGCLEYEGSNSGILSEENYNMTGTLDIETVKPEEGELCVGEGCP